MSERIFDKYEIVQRLAIGGMGEVFYAVQRGRVPGFERPAILKNLLPDLAMQPAFIEQFLDEARVAATLNHPNVVSIYEVGLWNGAYFIAMEYIRGCNLAQLIKQCLTRQLPVPPLVAARIVHDAALGLDHAHRARDVAGNAVNVVHRDISPQNIMVREDGVTKVVDFGIARASNRATRTATGLLKGKLAYMAPEQVTSGVIDGRTDQFALGVVLWELCTRQRLFTAEREVELISKVMREPIRKPSEVTPGLPADLDDIAMTMLQRDAAKRFATCAEVAQRLEMFLATATPPCTEAVVGDFLRAAGIDEPGPKVPTPSPNFVISLSQPRASESMVMTATMPSSSRGRRGVALSLALGLVAALSLGAFVATRQSAPLEPPVAPSHAPVTGAVDAGPRTVKLSVLSSPPAELTFDGLGYADTPQVIDVRCGTSHQLRLEHEGWVTLKRELTVDLCRNQSIQLELEQEPKTATPHRATPTKPPPVTPPPRPGSLSISVLPASLSPKVALDGKTLGEAPAYAKDVSAGTHQVRATDRATGAERAKTVIITSEQTTKVVFDFR